MDSTVNVKRSNRQSGKRIALDLECRQANEFAMNPYVLPLSGSIWAKFEQVSGLRLLFGTQEVTRIPIARRDLWKRIQSVIADPSRGRFHFMTRNLARRLFAEDGGDESLGPDSQDLAVKRGNAFQAVVPLLTLPQKGNLTIEAIFSSGAKQELCRLGYKRPAISSSVKPENDHFRPLSLTAIGRSGGTWTMHLLSQHPRILAIPEYPYEATIARDIMEAAVNSCTFTLFQDQFHRTCMKPLKGTIKHERSDWLDLTTMSISKDIASSVAATLHSALKLIRHYYPSQFKFRPEAAQNGSEPSYIMEKNMRPQRLFQELCPGAREIFLVRDFRDVISSSIAFNAKRGFPAFGREDVKTDRQFVWHRAEMARPWILEPWLERCNTALLVKYEDMVRNPHTCLRNILEYLELDASDTAINDMIQRARNRQKTLEGHMTSNSPEESVGRWTKDLDRNLREECQEAFAQFFHAFGYSA